MAAGPTVGSGCPGIKLASLHQDWGKNRRIDPGRPQAPRRADAWLLGDDLSLTRYVSAYYNATPRVWIMILRAMRYIKRLTSRLLGIEMLTEHVRAQTEAV